VTTKLLQRAFELDQRANALFRVADDDMTRSRDYVAFMYRTKSVRALDRKRKAAMTKHAHRCGWSKRTK